MSRFFFLFGLPLLIQFSNSNIAFASSLKCDYMAKRYAVEAYEKEIGNRVQSLGDFLNIITSYVYAGPGKEPIEYSVRITNLLDGGVSARDYGWTTVPDVNVYYKVVFELDYSTGTDFPIDICQPISVEQYNPED